MIQMIWMKKTLNWDETIELDDELENQEYLESSFFTKFKSAKRASATSFASICLESFLVAILQDICALLRSVAQEIDNPFGAFFAACAAVLVSCIESLNF
ncbi:7971_t:CDS:2 [Funneliformis mosseae]|uniref:Protein PNS1 n=1 Tax=Funneliformis mosseae TaxID=27381 RepID=A0A9N9EE85_FUNMO|nr:7971_t:CDS:2 [Funneliformis mosseae]